MIVVKQLGIILGMLFLGEWISNVFNILIPGNVIGMLLLLVLLSLKIIKMKDVEMISDFMIRYLAIFFMVPSVGIMLYLNLIKEEFLVIMVPILLSVVIGLLVTGKIVEILLNKQGVDTND